MSIVSVGASQLGATVKLIAACLFLIVWNLPAPGLAAQGSTNDLKIVGKCFTIHGRLFACNGTPSVRIWKIGTHRILGILPDEGKLPEEVERVFTPFETEIYADFLVCPITRPRPGSMQMVSLRSARNIVVKRLPNSASSNGAGDGTEEVKNAWWPHPARRATA